MGLKLKMKEMKKIILALCLITGFAACNTNEAGSPSAAVDGMFTAMKNGNIEEMKKFITKSDVAMMETAEKMMNSVNPEALAKMKTRMVEEFKEKAKDVKYSLKNEKIDGDNATVEAEVVENGKTSSHNLALVKEEGAWKISLTNPGNDMFNSMKGDMGADKHDINDAIEKLKSMPPDSLKAMMNRGLQALDSMDKMMKKQ